MICISSGRIDPTGIISLFGGFVYAFVAQKLGGNDILK